MSVNTRPELESVPATYSAAPPELDIVTPPLMVSVLGDGLPSRSLAKRSALPDAEKEPPEMNSPMPEIAPPKYTLLPLEAVSVDVVITRDKTPAGTAGTTYTLARDDVVRAVLVMLSVSDVGSVATMMLLTLVEVRVADDRTS